jgi:hypothetical protein
MKRFLALIGPLLFINLPALAQQEAVDTDGIQAVEEGEVEVDLDQEEGALLAFNAGELIDPKNKKPAPVPKP